MEATEALGRRPFTALVSVRQAIRSRSRTFWIVAGLTALAVLLRFPTLSLQAYHHDEVVTASRVLRDGFGRAMHAVEFSESAPPLYYALAWVWTQLTGTGEFGLRSISALAGVATVPVAYLLGAELRDRRAGIAAALLVASNPMLVWYSQEARAYSLFVLLTTVSALYFVRALNRGRGRDFIWWGMASALALATHYFAIFPVGLEALWLLARHRREALGGLGIVLAAGLLLAPLALHQMSQGHVEWISQYTLARRLWEGAMTFVVGETGDVIARTDHALPALLPLLVAVLGVVLLIAKARKPDWRAAGRMAAIAGATIGAPVLLALLAPGKDYVLGRNLLPALVPLLVLLAIATTMPGARRRGAALLAVLAAYSVAFCVLASFSPALQRPDWKSVADRLGEPTGPRVMVTWTLGQASLRHYLADGAFQVRPKDGFSWLAHEVDFISLGGAPPVPRRLLGEGFRQVGYEQVGEFYVRRYAMPGPALARLRLRTVREADLNFRSNGALLDGVGPF